MISHNFWVEILTSQNCTMYIGIQFKVGEKDTFYGVLEVENVIVGC